MSVHEHLEFRHLKYIIAIAEAGTFTAAAQRLHVSQSTLSTQIRDLEDRLGIEIFDREHGTALTTEGKVLIRYGLQSLQNREHLVLTLQAIHAGTLMPLRLGFTPFVDKALLRSVTELYKEVLIDCEIMPESDDTDELVSRVRQDNLDAAIVTLPILEDDVQVEVIDREHLVVCMRNDDPLAHYEAVPPEALTEKICIFTYQRHHPAAYTRLVEMFKEVGITPQPCKPTMNIDHVQWMVKEGVCYSLIRAGRPLVNGLVTRPVAAVDWTIDSAFISRTGSQHPALSLFIQELRKHFGSVSEIPEKKPVASVRVREASKRTIDGARENQLGLFAVHNGSGVDRHVRKLSRYRKQVLDE
jgi:DNA-binding transcriptional LysR family regulator